MLTVQKVFPILKEQPLIMLKQQEIGNFLLVILSLRKTLQTVKVVQSITEVRKPLTADFISLTVQHSPKTPQT